MPELPEVETVRRSLLPRVRGRVICDVTVKRTSVVRAGTLEVNSIRGVKIQAIERHGKELMFLGRRSEDNDATKRGAVPVFCIHLGMTGSLRYHSHWNPANTTGKATAALCAMSAETDAVLPEDDKHAHVIWRLYDGGCMIFRDPRRFGGVRVYPDQATARLARWSMLGPDALTITPGQLRKALTGRRPIKAALMDQRRLAGLGNIYADELLFACGIHPLTPAGSLETTSLGGMARRIRTLLQRAIGARGSTLRNHVDAEGRTGGYQGRHKVYGRGGKPCVHCGTVLASGQVGGRTTVHCPKCQRSMTAL